jgi:hypothetical protein
MKNTSCICVNTKVGSIAVKGGIKPVFILELVADSGELLVKFFNVNKTPKGNYSVNRNSDFGKLYRLTTGKNPIKKFSQCDQLLKHFIGYLFEVQYATALGKHDNVYQKVSSLKPKDPVITDEWTITGHLIKNVSNKGKNQGRTEEKSGKKWGKNGDCNMAQSQVEQGIEAVFDPIRHPPYQVRTSHIEYINNIEYIDIGILTRPPPAIDLATLEIDQKFLF